jgi:hypothetical protein
MERTFQNKKKEIAKSPCSWLINWIEAARC